MSVNHTERIEGVVKAHLKESAMGEPFGFAISPPSWWPFLGPDGKPVGAGPAWFIVVSIRATGLGEPDIYDGFTVPGLLPDDETFRNTARGLLESCRRQREARDKTLLEAVPAGPSMKLSERPT